MLYAVSLFDSRVLNDENDEEVRFSSPPKSETFGEVRLALFSIRP